MATESQLSTADQSLMSDQGPAGALRRTLLLPSVVLMVVSGVAAPLFTRIYFQHGGARLWLASLLQTCAFPILFLPLCLSYGRRRQQTVERTSFFSFFFSGKGRAAAAACVALGVVNGLDAYLYSYGSASLPLSTSALLMATLPVFTAAFAFLVVRQRFTAYSVNAVVLLVMGPTVLGLQAGGDRPAGESRARYLLGFFSMLGAVALYGLLMPLIELTWSRMKRRLTHVLVLETQVVLSVSGCVFCLVAMLINKDFQAIGREAKQYGLGETKYYLVLAAAAISWQLMGVGFVGVIFCSSSLLAGVVVATLVPLGEILPVLVLHEKFSAGKALAMALSIWGFVSYLYGEYRQQKKQRQTQLQKTIMADHTVVVLSELPTAI